MSISSLADFFYRAPHTKTDCKDKLFFYSQMEFNFTPTKVLR